MEKQQVQLTRMHFVDEIPEEVERLFRKSAISFSHCMEEPLIELTNLIEQKNYVVFLDKLNSFREKLARADMLLEDCNGIIRNYIAITTQPQADEQSHPEKANQGSDNVDIEALMQNMQEQAKKAQELQKQMGTNNVQEG